MSIHSKKTIVLGLGNTLYSDQGVALHALERLRKDPRLPKQILVLYRGTPALELLPELWDCARLLVVTAVDAGHPPGNVVRLRGEQLCSLERSGSRNQFEIADLYLALHLLARDPPQVLLFGVQAQSTARGSVLSSVVDKAIPTLIESVIAELTANTHRATA